MGHRSENSRPGRRDQLGLAVLESNRQPFYEFRSRRTGHGQYAVAGGDESASHGKRAGVHGLYPQSVKADGRPNNVENRINRPNLMKVTSATEVL